MAKYGAAQFGEIEVYKGKQNQSPDIVRWMSLLKREQYERYDEDLQDFDPLRSTVWTDRFFQLPSLLILVAMNQGGRPDLIAYDYFGDSDYYIFIMYYNRFLEETEFSIGREIRIPIKEELDRYLMQLRMQQER